MREAASSSSITARAPLMLTSEFSSTDCTSPPSIPSHRHGRSKGGQEDLDAVQLGGRLVHWRGDGGRLSAWQLTQLPSLGQSHRSPLRTETPSRPLIMEPVDDLARPLIMEPAEDFLPSNQGFAEGMGEGRAEGRAPLSFGVVPVVPSSPVRSSSRSLK